MSHHALACLLDEEDAAWLADLWREVGTLVGEQNLMPLGHPHVSLAVGRGVDLDGITGLLSELADMWGPQTTRTAGVAVFPSVSPALYLPVVRTPELDALHRALWRSGAPLEEPTLLYAPDRWIPHITIARLRGVGTDALDDATRSRLAMAMAALADRHHARELHLGTLAAITEEDGRPLVDVSLPLVGE